MDSFKCFIATCKEPAEILCSCSYPLIPICSNHIKDHTSNASFNRHSFRTSSKSHNFCLSRQNFLIEDQNLSHSDLIIAPYTGSVSILKLEATQIIIPNDYESALYEMTTIFASQIINQHKNSADLISDECCEFYKSCQVLIPNIVLELKKIVKDITVIFSEMHAKIQNETYSFLENFISSLAKSNLAKNFSEGASTKYAEEIIDLFFSDKKLEISDNKSLLKSMEKTFAKFFNPKEHLNKYSNDIENAWAAYKDIKHQYKKKISNYIKNIFSSMSYQRLAIYQPYVKLDCTHSLCPKSQKLLSPDWIMIYNKFFKTEKVTMSQPIEIGPNDLLVLLYFNSSNQSHLLLISEFLTSTIKKFHSTDMIIVSGSSYNQLLIINKAKNQLKNYYLHDRKLISMSKTKIELGKSSIITAAVVENMVLCTLSSGKIQVFKVDQGKKPEQIRMSFHEKDRALSVKYRARQKLIMLRTLEYVYFLNSNFEEVFKFKSLKKDVEIADNEGSGLYFYCLSKNKLIVWTYDLTVDERKKLNFDCKKLWERPTVSFWKKIIINFVSEDDIEENAYSDIIKNDFLPIVIEISEEITEIDSELEEESDEDEINSMVKGALMRFGNRKNTYAKKNAERYEEEVFEESKENILQIEDL
ncbi:hypothetical protein SteCoe_17177 [Stentor coeruleus]|uniref:Uncharacterized protein n=1 Tax=Stentor coeruleus TaxID=5963 RepID=A0A1R2BZK8_9CILI|nr:hypothetical protein SteCoe_17177 [Stentor coeruleus]